MGDTVNEYFCNILQTIVVTCNISPVTASVTFYSFGNGAVDVLIVIAAFLCNHCEIGLAASFSSGIFVCTICVAAILSYQVFNIQSNTFIRNIIFFFFTVLDILLMYYDGVVTYIEVIGFIMLYFAFVTVYL